MSARFRKDVRSAGAFALLLLVAACQSSEKIAPDGSTINLTATPATIVLANGVQASPIDILATVRNSNGLPLPDQDVRFSTTSGVLTPTAGLPIRTDDIGNALTVLTVATQSATITATSGKATQTLTLNTATCNLSSISLDQSVLDFMTCNDTDPLTATAKDTSGNPCAGVLLTFHTSTVNATTDVKIQASPGSVTTDANGDATFNVSLVISDCTAKCQSGGTGTGTCTGAVFVSSGSVPSGTIPISDSVP